MNMKSEFIAIQFSSLFAVPLPRYLSIFLWPQILFLSIEKKMGILILQFCAIVNQYGTKPGPWARGTLKVESLPGSAWV